MTASSKYSATFLKSSSTKPLDVRAGVPESQRHNRNQHAITDPPIYAYKKVADRLYPF